MNIFNDPQRRRFLRALTATGALTLAGPWHLRNAVAAVPGRAVMPFQIPPEGKDLYSELLSALHTRYAPDLGERPVTIPGAAGATAIEAVARSPRDGATVLIAPSTMVSLAPIVWKAANDPAESLVPVAGICDLALGFVVGPAVPQQVRTMADYLHWVRENPRSNTYGVPGLGTATHYVGGEIARLADMPLHTVGYKGTIALIQDVGAGHISACIVPLPSPHELAIYPQLRLLAVTGEQRLRYLPDVPTLREAGLAEYSPTESMGFFMPVGTPDQKVQELAAAVRTVIQSQAVTDALRELARTPMPVSGDSYATELTRERAAWKALVAKYDFGSDR